MQRRHFLETLAGGIAAQQLPVSGPGLRPGQIRAEAAAAVPRARWIEQGLIDAGGTHEPLIFVRRRGGGPRHAGAAVRRMESESLIRRLHAQGVEVFHTHLYKGFGMTAEQGEMEETRDAAALAHRLGMKVDTYIQWNSLMYETFFAEQPAAVDWIQRDAVNQPILLTYGYEQSFRFRPCFAVQAYLDYLKQVVRYAVVEVKTDFIHLDNFELSPEPDSCHNRACQEGFRHHLKTKYTAAERQERFGFETVDHLQPPLWNRWNDPESLDIIGDPVIQEWIDYRCQLLADALHQVAAYAKALNPEVVIEINPQGLTGANNTWTAAVDHPRLLQWTQAFWTEQNEQAPAFLPDGRLISKIRSYKLARIYHNVLLTFADAPEAQALLAAESLAFNQTIGFAGTDPLPPATLQAIAFYRRHRDLFVGTEDVAPIALLRSYASLTYHHSATGLSTTLLEQTVIRAKLPFALIFDEHLQHLDRFRVLLLPNTECLSDLQLEWILRFVEGGGGLLATEQAGLYDEYRRVRSQPGLHRILPTQAAGLTWQEREAENRQWRPGPTTRQAFGRGRVVYAPRLEFDGPLPPARPFHDLGPAFWKAPREWRHIADDIRWVAQETLPVEVTGPDFLAVNSVSQPQPRRLLVHLVNYGVATVPMLRGITVRCRWPAVETATVQVQAYRPDLASPVRISHQQQGNVIHFELPEFSTYVIAAMSW